jgi:hypothetical protein
MFKALCSVILIALLALPAIAQNNPGSAQSGAAPSTLVGCVHKTGDVYTLNDEASKITAQLRGGSLRNGRHVQVTGTAVANASPAGGATQVLDITSVTPVAGSCKAATSAGSSYVAPDAAKRGKIIGAFVIVAIATGVAIEVISRQGEARGGR